MSRRPSGRGRRGRSGRALRGRRFCLGCERLETRWLLVADVEAAPHATPDLPVQIPPDATAALQWSEVVSWADLATGRAVAVPRGGVLMLDAAPGTVVPPRLRITLRDAQRSLIADSTTVAGGSGPVLQQFLTAGTYDIVLESAEPAAGDFLLRFEPSASPVLPIVVGKGPACVVSVDMNGERIDLNGDGIGDLVVCSIGYEDADLISAAIARQSPSFDDPGGVTLLEGTTTGSFRVAAFLPAGRSPLGVAVGRVAGLNSPRLIVTANYYSDDVSVMRQDADGTFRAWQSAISVGAFPSWVALRDLNGDGLTDIVVANSALDPVDGPRKGDAGSVSVLLQRQDGTFEASLTLPVGGHPQSVAVATMNDDQLPDIVVVGNLSNDVSVLIQQSNGGFASAGPPIPVGIAPTGVAVADINRDRLLDIVVANSSSDSLSLLFQQRSSSPNEVAFKAVVQPVGINPYGVIVADVNDDKNLDLVSANQNSNSVSVLYGFGNGQFTDAKDFSTGSYASSVAAVTRPGGRVDLVTADTSDRTVSVLRGLGTDSFLERNRVTVGSYPYAGAVSDFDGDGRQDIVTANYLSGTVSVLLGRGDGSFSSQRMFPAGPFPNQVCVADVNADGRPDVLVASDGLDEATPEEFTGDVLLLLGLGDGTFRDPIVIAGGGYPVAIAVGDVDGDQRADIVVATAGGFGPGASEPDAVHILIQQPNGAFAEPGAVLAVGSATSSIVLDDVDRDGSTDVVVACRGGLADDDDGDVFVFFGDGTGAFPERSLLTAASHPYSLAVADVDVDGWYDIVVSSLNVLDQAGPGEVSVLIQSPGRRFAEQTPRIAVGVRPSAIVVADVTADGKPDIVVANALSRSLGVLESLGGGRFSSMVAIGLGGGLPSDLAVADVDGDGLKDIVSVNFATNDVTVLKAARGGIQVSGGIAVKNSPSQQVGLIASAGERPASTIAVDRRGAVKLRLIQEKPAVVGEPDAGGNVFAWAAVPVPDGSIRFASIDRNRHTITVSTVNGGGSLSVVQALAAAEVRESSLAASMFSRIVSADVDGNGWGDLIVSNPVAGAIDILVSGPEGRFEDNEWQRILAGAGTTRILLEDLNGDGVSDLIAANQVSGDVSVRYGVKGLFATAAFTAASGFGDEYRFRTSSMPYGYDIDPYSLRGTAVAPFTLTDVAVGDVTGDRRKDIVAVNSQTRSFTILEGLAGGGFSAPKEHLARMPITPAPVVASAAVEVQDVAVGDFDGDGKADIALLDRPGERILLYQSHTNPTYERPATVIPLTGNLPRSLLVADSTGPKGVSDGVLDILVGNDYGDVLVLQGRADADGKGTGEFETVVRTDKSVALMAADIDGDGKDDFVYGNKGLDRVTMSRTATKQSFEVDQKEGVIGPSAVATVVETVGGRQMKNLVVANGGANQIMLFSRNVDAATNASDIFLPPQRFFVGTNPSAISVADVNQDGIPDVVVANSGSNDISVMLGTMSDGRWTMRAGPRLAAGGTNPAGVAIGDFVTGSGSPGKDGIFDIAVTNRGSNSANIIGGRGQGFFNDQVPVPLVLPPNAQPGPIFANAGRIGIGNIGANSVTLFDTTRRGAGTESFASRTYSSGGSSPSSLATYTSGGTTYLAVGNLSGSVSLFLGRAGPLEFSLQNSFTLPNVTGLAFDSTGRLFGMSPARESALELFAFEGQASGTTIANTSLAALGAAVFYLPLRASAVALVATIVSSGSVATGTAAAGEGDAKAVPLNTEEKGEGDAAAGGSAEGDGAGQKRDAAQPGEDGTESKTGEDPAAAGLKLFLDIDKTLKANNGRLLETLLDDRPGEAGEAGEPDREAAEPDRAAGEAAESVPRPDGRLAVWRQWAEVKGHRDAEAGPRAAGWPGSTVELVVPVAFVFPATMADAACARMPPWTSGSSDESAPSRTRQSQRRRRPVHNNVAPGLRMDCKRPS